MITYTGASLNLIEDWLDHIIAVSPIDGSASQTSISWSVTQQPDDDATPPVATLVLQGDFSGMDPATQQVSGISAYDSNNHLLFTLGALQISLANLQQLASGQDLEDLLKASKNDDNSTPHVGSEFDDDFHGSNGSDDFNGGAGDDSVFGGKGNDHLYGEEGDDKLAGGQGHDLVSGGSGNDVLRGENGDDSLFGDDGDDRLDAGNGNDQLFGDTGMDRLFGGNGNDTISGGADDDVLNGGNGNDDLAGGDGNDALAGSGGNDVLSGGLGDDRLKGDGGNDILSGGEGNDELAGGGGNDELSGGSGNDVLHGEGGNDRLDGGEGQDWLYGEGGNDVYVIANADAVDTIAKFQSGKDTIEISGAAFGITDASLLSFAVGDDGMGHVYYDADGAGPGVAIEIVGVQNGTVNLASDVIVV